MSLEAEVERTQPCPSRRAASVTRMRLPPSECFPLFPPSRVSLCQFFPLSLSLPPPTTAISNGKRRTEMQRCSSCPCPCPCPCRNIRRNLGNLGYTHIEEVGEFTAGGLSGGPVQELLDASVARREFSRERASELTRL